MIHLIDLIFTGRFAPSAEPPGAGIRFLGRKSGKQFFLEKKSLFRARGAPKHRQHDPLIKGFFWYMFGSRFFPIYIYIYRQHFDDT